MNREIALLIQTLRQLVGDKIYFRDIERELVNLKELSPVLKQSLNFLVRDLRLAKIDASHSRNIAKKFDRF